jgi:hypothetical protein
MGDLDTAFESARYEAYSLLEKASKALADQLRELGLQIEMKPLSHTLQAKAARSAALFPPLVLGGPHREGFFGTGVGG